MSLMSLALAGEFFTTSTTWKPLISDHFDTKEISLEDQSDVKNRQFELAQEVRKQW